jgi:glycine/D-amino acid oxidase-like deaminating enzyme
MIRDEEKVLKIVPGHHVIVQTSKGRYAAKKLVLAAGPWTNKLTEPLDLHLPLTVSNTCLQK